MPTETTQEAARDIQEKPKRSNRILGMKRHHLLSAFWQLVVIVAVKELVRWGRPICLHFGCGWALELPAWFWPATTVLILLISYRLISKSHGFWTMLVALPYVFLCAMGFLLHKILGRTVWSIGRVIKTADSMILAWTFIAPALLAAVAILAYGLFGEVPSLASAYLMLVLVAVSLLYATRLFSFWLADPCRPYASIWEGYRDSLLEKATKIGARGVEIEVGGKPVGPDAQEISKLIHGLLERLGTRSALGTTFAAMLLSVIGFTVTGFAGIYRCLHVLDANTLRGVADPRWLDYLYFSVSTLFSAGAGDIVPATDGARVAAMLEIFMGLFLFILAVASFSTIGVSTFDDGMAKIAAEVDASLNTRLQLPLAETGEDVIELEGKDSE